MSDKLTACKDCGKEIARSAKVCPHCGAKHKKTILKKWWFWGIVIVLAVAIGSAGEEVSNENAVNNGIQMEENISAGKGETKTQTQHTTEKQEPTEATKPETTKGTETTKATKPSATQKTEATKKPTKETKPKVEMTTGQKNALKSAKSYLAFSAFSYEGLIKQLEFEEYSREDAVFAADNCGADWNEQALKSAKSYLSFSAFSYEGLIKQLEFENYTTEQATYGAKHCGADWNEQAVKAAKSYLDFSSFSKDGLIQQLEFEGFTTEQAEYGAKKNGYE